MIDRKCFGQDTKTINRRKGGRDGLEWEMILGWRSAGYMFRLVGCGC